MRAMRSTVSVFCTLLLSLVLTAGARAAELPDFRKIVKEGSPAGVEILVDHSSAHGDESPFESDDRPD